MVAVGLPPPLEASIGQRLRRRETYRKGAVESLYTRADGFLPAFAPGFLRDLDVAPGLQVRCRTAVYRAYLSWIS